MRDIHDLHIIKIRTGGVGRSTRFICEDVNKNRVVLSIDTSNPEKVEELSACVEGDIIRVEYLPNGDVEFMTLLYVTVKQARVV